MIFSISITRVSETIYASSALHSLLHSTTERPEVLTPDHSRALGSIIRHAFAHVCMQMLPYVVDCDMLGEDSDSDDILTINLRIPPHLPSTGIRKLQTLIESATTDIALADAYSSFNTKISDIHHTSSTDTLSRLRYTLTDTAIPPILPHW